MDVSRKYFVIIFVTLGSIVVVYPHSENKRLLLENEPNVDLDGELGQLRTQLLDQQRLIDAIQKELQLQKNTTEILKQQEIAATRKDLELQKNITAALQKDLELQKNITTTLKQQETATNQKNLELHKNITTLQQENEQFKVFQQGRGSVYVRWGRNVCPSTASIVYTGFTAGNYYNEVGSGSDNLCLPTDPTWSKYRDGASSDYRANIYGTEIDTLDSDHIFNYPVNEQDIPCVVCRSTKPTNVMIPARNNCYPGWTAEYNGYLWKAVVHPAAKNQIYSKILYNSFIAGFRRLPAMKHKPRRRRKL